jgi:DNA-binding HxlR family transcriptional regulator
MQVVLPCDMHLYGQYCPVARAAEILADRWTVLIVRELLADVNHFNELERGLPHMSRTLLAERLRRLERAGVLERRGASRGKPTEYRLTAAGRELQPVIDLFGEWGARWAFGSPRPSELDPVILLWWMRRRVTLNHFSNRRVVIQFDFRGTPQQSYWLLINRCLSEASRLRSGCDLKCRHQNVLPNLAWPCVSNGGHAQKSSWSEWQPGRYSRISHLVYLEPHGCHRERGAGRLEHCVLPGDLAQQPPHKVVRDKNGFVTVT